MEKKWYNINHEHYLELMSDYQVCYLLKYVGIHKDNLQMAYLSLNGNIKEHIQT